MNVVLGTLVGLKSLQWPSVIRRVQGLQLESADRVRQPHEPHQSPLLCPLSPEGLPGEVGPMWMARLKTRTPPDGLVLKGQTGVQSWKMPLSPESPTTVQMRDIPLRKTINSHPVYFHLPLTAT